MAEELLMTETAVKEQAEIPNALPEAKNNLQEIIVNSGDGKEAKESKDSEASDKLKRFLRKTVLSLINIGEEREEIVNICFSKAIRKGCKKADVEKVVDDLWQEILSYHGPFWSAEEEKGAIVPKISLVKFMKYLSKEGYGKYYLDDDYTLIKVKDNRVIEIIIPEIKDKIMKIIEGDKNIEAYKDTFLEILYSSHSRYFANGLIEFLPPEKREITRDKRDVAYFYFNNGYAEVTKEGVSFHDNYGDLGHLIWEKQIIRRDFKVSETGGADSPFRQFILNIAREDEARFEALCTAIGYLLHSYKDPSNAKAVIFCDEKISDNPNGRSGKSLVSKAISELRRSVRADGKNFTFDHSFAYQQVDLSTQILEFNDVIKGFPFEKLFSIITDSITVEKKQQHAYSIPFEMSPKVLISTNYTIKGSSDSYKARMAEYEFSDHYNADHQPINEFNKRFFDEWDEGEWNSFYNFMLWCVRLYLEKGLIEAEPINLLKRKAIDATSTQFVEYFETYIALAIRYDKSEKYNEFIREYRERLNYSKNLFKKNLDAYCNIMGMICNHQKSNGSQYFTVTKK
ncbi:MAG: hypothetical protein ACM3U0_01305 [archaeon]